MNKGAKEMFEELGYKQEHHIAYIKYTKIDDYNYYFVWFEQETESVEARFDIDMKLLQAINKQVEELGWGDSNE